MSEAMNSTVSPDTAVRHGLPWETKIAAGGFITSGVIHLVRPKVFRSLIPRRLGNPKREKN